MLLSQVSGSRSFKPDYYGRFMGQEKEEQEDKLKKLRKKAAAGTAAAGLSVSVLLGGLFSSPEELMKKNETLSEKPNPVVMTVDLDEPEPDEDTGEEEEQEAEGSGVFAKVKKKILELPAGVRALVGVPLWAVGWVIIHFLSLAWSAVLAPVLGFLLKWVLVGLALVGIFAAAMKCAFPNLPLKKILRPKNILFLLLGTVILGAADRFLPLIWEGYPAVRFVVILGGGFLVLLAVGIPFIIRRKRLEKEELLKKEEGTKVLPEPLMNTLEIVKKAEKAAFGGEIADLSAAENRREKQRQHVKDG